MDKPKFQPLVLIALIINAMAIGMLAYRNFDEEQTGMGTGFFVLSLCLLGMAGYGWKEILKQKHE